MSRQLPEWCRDHAEIARLMRWLHEGPLGPMEPENLIELAAKPWHFADEYTEMLTHERERRGPTVAREAEDDGELAALLAASVTVARAARGR